MNKRFNTFIIILSDIPDTNKDELFRNELDEKEFEWWRYIKNGWVILTPKDFTISNMNDLIGRYYINDLTLVLETHLNRAGTVHKSTMDYSENNPLKWFDAVLATNFIPKWEKQKNIETT